MKVNRLMKLHERDKFRQAKKKKKEKKEALIVIKRAETFLCKCCLSHFDDDNKLYRHM